MHAELSRLKERLEIPDEVMNPPDSSSAYNITRNMIKWINGTDKLHRLISYFLSECTPNDKEIIERFSTILSPYGYTVGENRGQVVLMITTSEQVLSERKRQLEWIKENAPPEVLDRLTEAKRDMSEGDWDDALEKCRKVLEGLTPTGNLGESLDELERKGVIQKGTVRRKKDYILLKDIYGFCSTYGAHQTFSRDADEERARIGLLITEAVLYYLSKRIKDARNSGVNLSKWK